VWALVRAVEADAFIGRWSSAYKRAYPELAVRAEFFATAAGRAAGEL
jgi:hypothetical protein